MSSFLSDDIVVEILSRLPVKSILRFRCVCKPWCNLISNPNFVKMHYNHGVEKEKLKLTLTCYNGWLYSINNYDDLSLACYAMAVKINHPFGGKNSTGCGVDIRGACNGLLCLESAGSICLWNPSTKEYKKIPIPIPGGDEFRRNSKIYGFCYDCNIQDYKVLRIHRNTYGCRVQVYTLGSDSWQNIPVIYPCALTSSPVLVNGDLHWIGFCLERGYSKIIASFGIKDERFNEVSSLEFLDNCLEMSLAALRGCLGVVSFRYGVRFDVWVMNDYGVGESWTKLLSIPKQLLGGCFPVPIQSFKNGETLWEIENALVLYDTKHERATTLQIQYCMVNWFNVTAYVENLVSLNAGTYVDQELLGEAIGNMMMKKHKIK